MAEMGAPSDAVTRPPTARGSESAARGTVLLSIGQGARVVSSAVIYVIAGRVLSNDDYGRFAVVFVAFSWTGVLLESIVLPGLRKIVSEDERRLRAALAFAARWYLSAALLLGAAFCAAAPVLAGLLGDRQLTWLFVLAGAQLPLLGVVKLAGSLLTGIQHYMAASAVRIAYMCLRALGACALLLLGLGVAGAMAGLGAGALLAAAASAVLLWRASAGLPSAPHPEMRRRVVYWTSVWLPADAAYATLMTLDVWLVKGMMEDPNAAGAYAVAYSLSRVPMFLMFGLGGAVFPRVSAELAQGNAPAARLIAFQAMRFLMIVFVPCCCFFAASAPEAIGFLYSSRYLSAGLSLAILGPAIYCAAQMELGCLLIAAADRPGIRLALTVAVLAVAAVCNVALIPALGMAGAALASLIAFGVGAVAGTALVGRVLRVGPPVRTALRCCLAGGLLYAVSRFWPAQGWVVAAKVPALGALYIAALFALRELRMEDLRMVWDGLRRRPEPQPT